MVQSDRGGQITYHGPGQLIVYFMINFKNHIIKPTDLVKVIEKICLSFLQDLGVTSHLLPKAPGVYIDNKKLISIGLRIKNYCSYHGIALNINTNLEYFKYINPCGFTGMQMINLQEISPLTTIIDCKKQLQLKILEYLDYPL